MTSPLIPLPPTFADVTRERDALRAKCAWLRDELAKRATIERMVNDGLPREYPYVPTQLTVGATPEAPIMTTAVPQFTAMHETEPARYCGLCGTWHAATTNGCGPLGVLVVPPGPSRTQTFDDPRAAVLTDAMVDEAVARYTALTESGWSKKLAMHRVLVVALLTRAVSGAACQSVADERGA